MTAGGCLGTPEIFRSLDLGMVNVARVSNSTRVGVDCYFSLSLSLFISAAFEGGKKENCQMDYSGGFSFF